MGAVSFAIGTEGSTYAKGETVYTLTGWTLDAIGNHERWLEKRAVDTVNRMPLSNDQKTAALGAVAKGIACFEYGYGGESFDKSLKTYWGLGHFFWQLSRPAHPKLTLAECEAMVKDDPQGVQEAVYLADPQNRATAEPLKNDQNGEKAAS